MRITITHILIIVCRWGLLLLFPSGMLLILGQLTCSSKCIINV